MEWILKNKEWNEYWRIRRMEWVGIRNGMNIEGWNWVGCIENIGRAELTILQYSATTQPGS